MILTLLLWFFGTQDASWPVLPPKLQEDESLRQTYESGLQNGSSEERASACAALLEALPGAEPAAQAEFLIGLSARADLDFEKQLGPACARLHKDWGAFSARIEEVLQAAAMPDANEQIVAVAPGALRVAAALGLEAPTRVEAVAGLLDHGQLGLQARDTLREITGHEFSNQATFLAWWETARGQSRVDWLVSANAALRSEVLSQWKGEIEAQPARALDAVLSDKREVRSLGYERLGAITPEMAAADGRVAIEVFRAALEVEREADFRVALLNRLAPMLEVTERLTMLQEVVLDTEEVLLMRLAACDALVVREHDDASFNALLAMLGRCYGEKATESRMSLPVRRRLLEAMQSHLHQASDFTDLLTGKNGNGQGEGQQGPDERLAILEEILFEVMAGETDLAANQATYRLVGALSSSSAAYSFLRGKAAPPDGGHAESDPLRPTVVFAFGMFIGRNGAKETDIQTLSGLLEDPEEEVRYAAAEALGVSQSELGFVSLAQHLSNSPGSESLTKRILAQLKRGKHTATVPYLLDFEPDPADRNRYRDVLERQINGDVPTRLRAMVAMANRGDWEMAHRLDRRFPAPVEGEAPDLDQLRVRARTAGEWALRILPKPKADDAIVETAMERLTAVRALDTEAVEWPLMEGRLHLRLEQDKEAFEDLAPHLAALTSSADSDALIVAVLEAAQRAGLGEQAMELESALPALSTESSQTRVAALFNEMRPAPTEAVVQGEESDQPEAQGSPAPAEGGGAGTGEPKVGEQPAETPPASEDPGASGGEPKDPKEPSSGDGNRS